MFLQNIIAITIDDNYVQHACVMLLSLDANINVKADVYCIYNDLSEVSKTRILKELSKTKLNLTFIEFNNSVLPNLPIKPGDHVSATAFLRIWLPHLFPGLDQILFMDTDMVITDDINELLNFKVDNYPLAAVPDFGMSRQKKAGLGMDPEGLYFNSGVMVLNLAYFRQYHLTEQISEFITLHPELCEFWDQDAINAVIKSNFYQLPYAYNVQTAFFDSNDTEIQKAVAAPYIIHFTGSGSCKPWSYHNKHPYRDLYYKYLRTTSFRFYHPPDLPRNWRIFRKLKFKLFYK